MSSEAHSINLKNTSFQFFDLAVMTVDEKIELKKKLKLELIRIQSSSKKVGTGYRNSPGSKFSCVVEDKSAATRSEKAVEIVEASSFMTFEKEMTSSSGNQQTSFVYKRKDDIEHLEHSASLSAVKKPKIGKDLERSSFNHRKLEFQRDKGMDPSRVKQCSAVLHKLMSHKYGWVFNHPVDPVALKIPDYFTIITKPMDLGTIKHKLKNKKYSDVNEFADDVKLTFSNAMRYNPPNNDVHLMAKKLSNEFSSSWEVLEAKWDKEALCKLSTKIKTHRQDVNYAHCEVQCPMKGIEVGSRKCPSLAQPVRDEFPVAADDGGSSISADQFKQPEFCPSTPPVTSSKGEERVLYNEQLSPSKALRAAILKSRFADTILKAQHKTLLDCGEKRDQEKMQKEIERLEREQREEKERIEAQIRASAAAIRRKQESEQRLQREKEREAARLAIQKMEKTVDIDENWRLPKDLQSLGGVEHSEMPVEVAMNFMDGNNLLPAGAGNPLEQLGLFMKNDELDDEEEEWFCDSVRTDVEEGEIGG